MQDCKGCLELFRSANYLRELPFHRKVWLVIKQTRCKPISPKANKHVFRICAPATSKSMSAGGWTTRFVFGVNLMAKLYAKNWIAAREEACSRGPRVGHCSTLVWAAGHFANNSHTQLRTHASL